MLVIRPIMAHSPCTFLSATQEKLPPRRVEMLPT